MLKHQSTDTEGCADLKSWNRYVPEGMKDYIFDEGTIKIQLEEKIRKVFISRGYKDVITPTIEYYDVFNCAGKVLEQENMFKLFDRMGRILVLKPDMTTPIARIAGTKFKSNDGPFKVCYSSQIYRLNENLNGKLNEITQSGIEVIGIEGTKADAEVIITGIKSLLACGIADFKIEIGQAKFFNSIVSKVNFSDDEKEKLRRLVEDKSYGVLSDFIDSHLESIDEKTAKVLKLLPEFFGSIEILEYAKKYIDMPEALDAIENIRVIYDLIDDAGLGKYVSVDLGMVHHLEYYTGVIFRGYSSHIGENIISGGRYDRLIESFGNSMSSTGMAINIDSILEVYRKIGITETHGTDVIIYFEEKQSKKAYALSDYLENNDLTVEISMFSSKEATMEYAQKSEISYVVIVEKDGTSYYENTEEKNDVILAIINGGIDGAYKDSISKR